MANRVRGVGMAGVMMLSMLGGALRSEATELPSNEVSYSVVGPTIKVRPTAHVNGSSSAEVFGGRNEFVSFQVVIQATSKPVSGLSVALDSPLTGPGGTIPAGNVIIYREAYYRADRASTAQGAKGRWPDALIPTVDPLYGEPRTAFPINVPAGENRVAFVDILVPRRQEPGSYEGTIRLTADGAETSVPITLDVRGFTLPSTSSTHSMYEIDWITPCSALYGGCTYAHDRRRAWRTNYDFARLALDNRITIADPQFQPPVDQSEVRYFHRYMEPLVEGTAGTRLRGARMSNVHIDTGDADQVQAWKSLAESVGFSDLAYSYDGECDEPGHDAHRWAACRAVVEMIDGVWPDLPNVVTINIDEATEFDGLELIDVIVPVIDQIDGKHGSAYAGDQRPKYDDFLADPGKQIWLYTSCDASGCGGSGETGYRGWVDYTIDTAASQNRAMGWMLYEYEASGELYYSMDYSLKTAWTDQWAFGGNGDGTLFYPGTIKRVGGTHPIPIESLRLKLIRNGNQDNEYLRLAADAGHASQAMEIARGLFPSTHGAVATDPEVETARRAVADLIG